MYSASRANQNNNVIGYIHLHACILQLLLEALKGQNLLWERTSLIQKANNMVNHEQAVPIIQEALYCLSNCVFEGISPLLSRLVQFAVFKASSSAL